RDGPGVHRREAHERVCDGRLSRAGLADQAHGLAGAHVEADSVNRDELSTPAAVDDCQVTHFKQRGPGHDDTTPLASSLERMQRAARDVPWVARPITPWVQSSTAKSHRGAKRQPSGQEPGGGTAPLSAVMGCPATANAGCARSRPRL